LLQVGECKLDLTLYLMMIVGCVLEPNSIPCLANEPMHCNRTYNLLYCHLDDFRIEDLCNYYVICSNTFLDSDSVSWLDMRYLKCGFVVDLDCAGFILEI